MFPGVGTGDITRRMFMVKFGLDKCSFINAKTREISFFIARRVAVSLMNDGCDIF